MPAWKTSITQSAESSLGCVYAASRQYSEPGKLCLASKPAKREHTRQEGGGSQETLPVPP